MQLGKIGKRNTYRRGSLDEETGDERREAEAGPRPKAGGNKHHSQNVNVLVAGAGYRGSPRDVGKAIYGYLEMS